MQSIIRLFSFVILGCFLCTLAPLTSEAQSGNWQVRRRDRSQIVIRRLKGILKNKPFSSYAFRQLMRYYGTSSAKRKLEAYYKKALRRSPSAVNYKIILARLYRYQRKFTPALQMYQRVRKVRPKSQAERM